MSGARLSGARQSGARLRLIVDTTALLDARHRPPAHAPSWLPVNCLPLSDKTLSGMRYHAVMEVTAGAPVTEVAHQPRFQARQLNADIEALICYHPSHHMQ